MSWACRSRGARLALAAAFTLLAFHANAKPTAQEDAVSAVSGWLKHPGHGLNARIGDTVKDVEVYNDAAGGPLYYIVNLKPSGFVIVPADDLLEPVIGFSPAGKYVASAKNPLGALVMRDIPARLAFARAQSAPDKPRARLVTAQAKWQKLKSAATLLTANAHSSVSDVCVAPLLSTLWDQATVLNHFPGLACYNYYTPPGPDGSQDNYGCGCVATAMAQFMRYWNYPATAVGTQSFQISITNASNFTTYRTVPLRGGDGLGGVYDWADMVAVPNNSSTLTQRQAIGALCYDAAVSVSMDFSPSGSGAYLSDAAYALQNTFKYANVISGGDAVFNIGSGLAGMVNPNLDAATPVILGIPGHAVIADGYGYDAGTIYHHINMGWSGADNAWYNLPNIDDVDGDRFDAVDSCLYNIYESGSGEIISGRVLDMSGLPISGATITAVGSSPGNTYSATTGTSTRGVFAFAHVPSASSFTLTAASSGHYFLTLNATTGTSGYSSYTAGNAWGINFLDQGAPPSGSLQVTLAPGAAITAGAKWNVDGGAWQSSGAVVSGLSLGSHLINYNSVSGWNSPASASATIANRTTTSATGTYVQQTGGLTVTLGPSGAVSAGAQWNVDGGAWQNSGVLLTNIPVGDHTVNFNTIYGWTTPPSATATIVYNSSTALTGTYVVQLGNLTVTLLPAAAVTAGAQWRVDGGAWQNSGDVLVGLTVASHSLDYNQLAGWASPPSESVLLSNNQTTSLTRTYAADLTPPTVTNIVPAPNSWNASRDTVIALHVTDAGAGVDPTTIVIHGRVGPVPVGRSGKPLTAPTLDTIYSGATAAANAGGWYSYDATGNANFPGMGYCVSLSRADCLFIFQPSANFDYDEPVTITVAASDLAGNAMTLFAYSFTTDARSFGINVRVDGGAAANAAPSIAVDHAGNIWVAWQRTDATVPAQGQSANGAIWLAELSKDGSRFGQEIQVTSVAQNGPCYAPSIAIATNGIIYVAYQMGDASNGLAALRVGVSIATTSAPTQWSSLGPVSDGNFTLNSSPVVTVNSANTAYVAGVGLSGGVRQIGVGTFANNATNWTVRRLTSDAGDKAAPALAKDASDVVYVVWQDGADGNIYGADSTGWGTIHPVTSTGNAGSPAIATEASGNILHFAWTATGGAPDPDILCAASTGGWTMSPSGPAGVLDATTGIVGAASPKLAVAGAAAAAKVFVVWQDQRSTVAGDTDIIFAESRTDGSFGANVRVSRVASGPGLAPTAAKTNPAIGLTADGVPLAAWTDCRENGASHVYFAEAMDAAAFGSVWSGVTPAGGVQSFTDGTNPHFTEVDLVVPADALTTPRDIAISELRNPCALCPGGTGLFADGSGLYLDIAGGDDNALGAWITIAVHLPAGFTPPSPLTVYRLVPPATPLDNWTWTRDLLRNVSYNATTRVLTFDTMHLSSFGAGTGASAIGSGNSSGGGGGGGGGGCTMSPAGEPDFFVLCLPLSALAFWAISRGRRKAAGN